MCGALRGIRTIAGFLVVRYSQLVFMLYTWYAIYLAPRHHLVSTTGTGRRAPLFSHACLDNRNAEAGSFMCGNMPCAPQQKRGAQVTHTPTPNNFMTAHTMIYRWPTASKTFRSAAGTAARVKTSSTYCEQLLITPTTLETSTPIHPSEGQTGFREGRFIFIQRATSGRTTPRTKSVRRARFFFQSQDRKKKSLQPYRNSVTSLQQQKYSVHASLK